MQIALAVPHTPWIPERAKALADLTSIIGPPKLFTEREPNWSWSAKLWQWGLDSGSSHLLQVQDDVKVTSRFWHDIVSMVRANPKSIIGLESVHPASQTFYQAKTPWYTTADGLIGVGYILPRNVIAEFLEWRSRLRPGAIQAVSEDTMIDMFCVATRKRVWHPVPTIIDHDTDMPSTYGNDWHSHRKPVVTTVQGARQFGWTVPERVPHVGRFYHGTPRFCRRWVPGFHLDDYVRACAEGAE